MSRQLPSPAPSDRKSLVDALSLEDLRAAFTEEKIENAKLENKVTELEEKMELLEKQVRDLEAEPWGKKKVRQLKERKRAREEAKAQRALARGDGPPAKRAARRNGVSGGGQRRESFHPADTAAVEADVTAEAPKESTDTNGPVEIPGLGNLPAEEEDKVLEEKAVLEESIKEPVQTAPATGAPAPEEAEDVDMIEDEVDGGSLFSDDEFDFFASGAEDQDAKDNDPDIIPSVEPCSSPVSSPTFEKKVPQDGGLKAKWKSGMLELERLQESERGIRSGNPSPLSAPNSAVRRLSKPFQAFVSDESALDASKDHVMSLRGGAGEPAGASKKRKMEYKSMAGEAIQKVLQELNALNNPEKLQLPFPPMNIQIDELVLEPYSSILGQPIDRSQMRKKRKSDQALDKLDETQVTILEQNPQDTEPKLDNPLPPSPPRLPSPPKPPATPGLPLTPQPTTSPEHFNLSGMDPDTFTFAQPSPLETTFTKSTTSKANKLSGETSGSPAVSPNKDSDVPITRDRQEYIYTLANSGIPEDRITLVKALEARKRTSGQAEQSTPKPPAPKLFQAASPKARPSFDTEPKKIYQKPEALSPNRVDKQRRLEKSPKRSGRLSTLLPHAPNSPTQREFEEYVHEKMASIDKSIAGIRELAAEARALRAAHDDTTPIEQLPEWDSQNITVPTKSHPLSELLTLRDRAAPLGAPLYDSVDRNTLDQGSEESKKILEVATKESTASGRKKRSWDQPPWTSSLSTNKSSPLDTQPPTPPPWKLSNRPPTPAARARRFSHRARHRSPSLIGEDEQEAEQAGFIAASSTSGSQSLKAKPFTKFPARSSKKVQFVLPGDSEADEEFQADIASQSDTDTSFPTVYDTDI